MKKYFSQYYNVTLDGDESWFDLRLDQDTHLYIDPFLVFRSDIPVFNKAREKFRNFFKAALELVFESSINSNALEQLEENVLWFPEPMEIRLGESKGKYGAGPGKNFSKACTQALIKLSRRGLKELENFEKIQLFSYGIAADGISDTTANIIKEELIQYTQEICQALGIPTFPCAVEKAIFDFEDKRWYHGKYNLPINPFLDNKGIILVPKEFLCSIHTINSDGFSEYVARNKSGKLRSELNYEIEKSIDRKIIIEMAEKYPEWIEEYVESREIDDSIAPYDLSQDDKNLYRPQKEVCEFVDAHELPALSASTEDEFNACVQLIISKFQLYVEEQGGYKLLWNDAISDSDTDEKDDPTPRGESAVQQLFLGIVSSYCKANNIDLSREVETGRGPVDFKFSSGHNYRALIEMKLAKSGSLKKGFENQLPTYLKSEQVRYGYYVVILYEKQENKRVEKIFAEVKSKHGELQGQVIIIDATRDKPSASKL
jgi:hypothetical protein